MAIWRRIRRYVCVSVLQGLALAVCAFLGQNIVLTIL